eukprot:65728-Prorocentrum_minimum.AAC.1
MAGCTPRITILQLFKLGFQQLLASIRSSKHRSGSAGGAATACTLRQRPHPLRAALLRARKGVIPHCTYRPVQLSAARTSSCYVYIGKPLPYGRLVDSDRDGQLRSWNPTRCAPPCLDSG